MTEFEQSVEVLRNLFKVSGNSIIDIIVSWAKKQNEDIGSIIIVMELIIVRWSKSLHKKPLSLEDQRALDDEIISELHIIIQMNQWYKFMKIYTNYIKLIDQFQGFDMISWIDFLATHELYELYTTTVNIISYKESSNNRFSLS